MIALRNLPVKKIAAQKNFIFEIGSESCCIKFCNEIENFIKDRQLFSGRKLRLVTPRVPQAHVERVVECILEAIGLLDIDTIIINDYGILYELRNAGVTTKFIFGRLLVRSQEYELNYKKRLDPNENEDVLESWLKPSILYTKKVEMLKKMNFTGVELSPSDSVKDLLLNVNEFDLDVHVHYNLYVGAVGRACVSAKYNNMKTGDCAALCDTLYDVKFARMYGNFGVPTEEEIEEFNDNVVIGNIIYFLKKIENFPFEKCKDVIIDTRIDSIRTGYVKNILEELKVI